MKKIILTVAAVFALSFANAQDKKAKSNDGFSQGDVFVTGAFTVNSTNNKNTEVKTSGFEIAPQVNYFLTDNISLGAKIGYSSDKTKNATATLSDMSTIAFGLAGRYYFTPSSQFSLFAQLGLDYSTKTNNLSDPKVKTNGLDVAFAPGLNYFVSKNFSIETKIAVLGFGTSKTDQTGDNGSSSFNFGGDWRAVSFGVNYKF